MARNTLALLSQARDSLPEIARFVRNASAFAREAHAVLEKVAGLADGLGGGAAPMAVFERDPKTGVYRTVEKKR